MTVTQGKIWDGDGNAIMPFDGANYEAEHDGKRLTRQSDRVFDYMRDGKYRTLGEIAFATGYPESSVSAQLRNFRKPSFGSHTVLKQASGDRGMGLWEYKLVVNVNFS